MNEHSIFIQSPDKQPQQLYQLLSRFIQFIDAKPKTIEAYSRALKQFLKHLSAEQIQKPQRADILTYRDQLKASYKPNTVNAYLIAVKRFFQWLSVEGYYDNIAEGIKGAKIGKKSFKKDALTSRQAREVIEHLKGDSIADKRNLALFLLMVTTGLRTIEVSRANVEDMRSAADETILYIQGKGQDEKSEYVKLAAPVEKAIREYLAVRNNADPSAPLFISESNNSAGERMTTRSISGIIKTAFIKSGYNSERITAHSLRHTAATLNLINGATLEETQQLLRHADINTTLIYAQHISRSSNNSEYRIAAAIFN